MNVSAPSILRPIATALIALAVTLWGVLGYLWLPVSSLPQVDFPTIQVTTQLPGANPDTMANLVAAPLERQLGQIPALQLMTSSSSFGITQITLQFDLSRDIDAASQDVQSAINAAASTLLRNLPYPPIYAKVNPADAPIATVALASVTLPLRDLSDLADTLVAQRLSSVSGVGSVSVQGGIRPAVRIQADLSRLAVAGLGLEDIRTAIAAANVTGPRGSLDGPSQSYTIAANDQLAAAEAYRSLIIAYRGGNPVLLRDVATVVDGLVNDRVGAWYQGRPAVVIDIQRQPGANVIETVARIRGELPRLARALPAGAELQLVHDRTGTIRASIHEVQLTLVLSVGLVILVVLLFLRSFRATIIAGVALPISLIATFGVMWLAGFSLDNLSLMALTISAGFIVDDVIVMVENIHRHIEDGVPPFQAALDGSREIGFTVISLTMSLVAVFIPLLFMSGLVGRMFREVALTLTIAVLVSMVVSLTLTPMMCSRLLGRTKAAHRGPRGPLRAADAVVDRIVAGYRRTLEWVVAREGLTLAFTGMTIAVIVWLYFVVPKGFLPLQDTGMITAVLEAQPEASFEEMRRQQARVAELISKDSAVAGVVSVIGVSPLNPTPNAGRVSIILRPLDEGRDRVEKIIARLRQGLAGIPGAVVHMQPVQDVQISTRPARALFQYTLVGSDKDEVLQWARRLHGELRADRRLSDVASEAQEGGLRAFINVDRSVAGRLGVSMQAIGDTLNSAFGQRQISTIYAQSNQYRVVLEADPRYQTDPAALARIYVPSTNGQQVPLGSIARIERQTAPLVVQRQGQFPAVTLSFNLAQGQSLGAAILAISEATRRIEMPGSVTGTFTGDTAEFERSLAGQPWLILAAVIAIYIVLGVLYESLIHPVTILSTLPSAGIGAVLALLLTGLDMSLMALIGIILLMGIVKKNAIMMIDFALEAERERGMAPRDAILEAAMLRFRPIMMTTLAALLGALPLALSPGAGSELRMPLGITIIGGLLLSQLLTLYTTPVIYLTMDRIGRRASDWWRGEPTRKATTVAEAVPQKAAE